MKLHNIGEKQKGYNATDSNKIRELLIGKSSQVDLSDGTLILAERREPEPDESFDCEGQLPQAWQLYPKIKERLNTPDGFKWLRKNREVLHLKLGILDSREKATGTFDVTSSYPPPA